jgi:hypothetical protein
MTIHTLYGEMENKRIGIKSKPTLEIRVSYYFKGKTACKHDTFTTGAMQALIFAKLILDSGFTL